MSSSALASARKRRSGVETVAPPPASGRPGQPSTPGQPGTGLTIQQVIALVDKRLLTLESFMKDSQSVQPQEQTQSQLLPDIPTNIKELLEEYGSRFDIIADELASIKNMMLSLQSFTMDVNKKLMDERIRILSAEDEAVPTPLERELELELEQSA